MQPLENAGSISHGLVINCGQAFDVHRDESVQ
jgi:hypothetical protein